MKRLSRALCIAVFAAAWSVPLGTTAEAGQARQRGSRPGQAQRAPQRAPQRAAPPRAAPARRAAQPRRAAGASRPSAPPAARRGGARRAAPQASAPARAGGSRAGRSAPRATNRAVPRRAAPRSRIGETSPRDAGRSRAVSRVPNRRDGGSRAGGTSPRTTTRRAVPERAAPRGRIGGTSPRDAGRPRAVRRAPDRGAGGTAPRDGDRRVGNRAATRGGPADTARRGARPRGEPGIGVVDNARRGGRIAGTASGARTGRRGADVVDRRGPRGNAVRRSDAPLASRPIIVNNYVDGGGRGYRRHRSYRGRHHYGIPHIHGSYFYFPGYSTFSLGVAVGSGLRYYDPYWNPYWYGYYGHRYGYTAWDPGVRYDYYTGSLRLKVRPRFAEVHVDGYYAGQVDNYDGIFQRLRLEEGPHHIEIRYPGFVPLEFEVMILPGETITYEGLLQPL